jgi:glycosyltransferase involved in cell wall biosynthesis
MKVLFIDFNTHIESLDEMVQKGRGGMTNSLFKVPDYLSSHGVDVYVASDIKKGGKTSYGTVWLSSDDENEVYHHTWDAMVTNRGIGRGYLSVTAKNRILWTHDLPHSGFAEEPDLLKLFSRTVFMSNYAEKVWRTFFKDIRESVLIPNGVDKSLFYPRQKDLNYIIYFSHPIRGIRRLPLLITGIIEYLQRPIVCKTFSSHYTNENATEDHMDHYVEEIIEDGDNPIEYHDAIPINEIAEEVGKAGLFVLPTGYPEICSNAILQSLASGTPIVTTGNLGSAPEWIVDGYNGHLTTFTPADYMVHSIEMARGIVHIMEDEERHMNFIRNAAETKNILSWEEVGALWFKMLNQLS